MGSAKLSRRAAMRAAALGLLGAGSAPLPAGSHAKAVALDLDDPATRARVRAKITGSASEAEVHGLSQLHIYAYLNEGNVKPLMTMWNYTVTYWQPETDTRYTTQRYESGIYTKFNTKEVIDVWDNPITGEQREVWPFLSGPIRAEVGPDGIVTGPEAAVHPESLGIQIIGDQVFLPTQSSFSFPNPFSPEKWPKESAGPMYFWDSFFTLSARLQDVADPERDSVPASSQFQNLVSWHPWLGMGGLEGRTFGRAFGSKLTGGFDELPEFLQAAIKTQTPEMLETEGWTEFRNDFADYMQSREPGG